MAELLDPALGANLVIGGVDRGQFVIRDFDEFLGHPLCDQAVGVVLTDQLTIGRFDCGIVHIMAHAEHCVGVGFIGPHILFADAGKIGFGKIEYRSHILQINQLVFVYFAIGQRDVEQAIEQLFETPDLWLFWHPIRQQHLNLQCIQLRCHLALTL